MRALTYVPGSLKALSKVLDFEGHPVRTIGYVAASVSTALVATHDVCLEAAQRLADKVRNVGLAALGSCKFWWKIPRSITC